MFYILLLRRRGNLSDFFHHDGVFLLLLVDEKEAPPHDCTYLRIYFTLVSASGSYYRRLQQCPGYVAGVGSEAIL